MEKEFNIFRVKEKTPKPPCFGHYDPLNQRCMVCPLLIPCDYETRKRERKRRGRRKDRYEIFHLKLRKIDLGI